MKTSRRFIKAALLAAVCTAAVFFSGCGGSPPELLQLFRQTNVVSDRELGLTYESMSLWINCSDDDGTEDFESLYLIHDEEELYWELTDETWTSDERASGYWIGTNELVMNDRSDFPPGNYRVVLIDAAGDRDERRIFVSRGPDHEGLVFPRLVSGDQWEFRSPHRDNLLWVYVPGGRLVGTYTIEGDRFDPGEFIREIARAREEREEEQKRRREDGGDRESPGNLGSEEIPEEGTVQFHAYSYDDDRGVGLVSGPYAYTPSGD